MLYFNTATGMLYFNITTCMLYFNTTAGMLHLNTTTGMLYFNTTTGILFFNISLYPVINYKKDKIFSSSFTKLTPSFFLLWSSKQTSHVLNAPLAASKYCKKLQQRVISKA